MPISAIDGCTESHWADVLEIISDAISDAGFEANLVSNAEDVGIIQKRIIQNLYDNPIVICDVSGKNPNVMFELGLRLAFDKPTIILKDDKTSYSFDTSPIEHLLYPRDLRFSSIVQFKEQLTEKISATHEKASSDTSYTTFLKHFGEFTIAKLDKKEVSGQEFILEELRNLGATLRQLQRRPISSTRNLDICLKHEAEGDITRVYTTAVEHPSVREAFIEPHGDHKHLVVFLKPDAMSKRLEVRELLSMTRKRAMRRVKAQSISKIVGRSPRTAP